MNSQGAAPSSRCGGREEIGVPGRPVVAVRVALAASHSLRGTDSHDRDNRRRGRSGPGSQSATARATWAKGQASGSLQAWYFFSQSLSAATSVADHRDAADRTPWERQILVQYRCGLRTERNGRLTSDDREGIRSRCSARHGDVEAIHGKGRAVPVDNDTRNQSSVGTELEPRREAMSWLLRLAAETRLGYLAALRRSTRRRGSRGESRRLIMSGTRGARQRLESKTISPSSTASSATLSNTRMRLCELN